MLVSVTSLHWFDSPNHKVDELDAWPSGSLSEQWEQEKLLPQAGLRNAWNIGLKGLLPRR